MCCRGLNTLLPRVNGASVGGFDGGAGVGGRGFLVGFGGNVSAMKSSPGAGVTAASSKSLSTPGVPAAFVLATRVIIRRCGFDNIHRRYAVSTSTARQRMRSTNFMKWFPISFKIPLTGQIGKLAGKQRTAFFFFFSLCVP